MRRFAETCEAVAAASGKNEKVRLLSAYLSSLTVDEAASVAVYFCGRAFPRGEEKVLAAGGSLIWQAVTRIAGAAPEDTEALYRKHGDLGAMAGEILQQAPVARGLRVDEAAAAFEKLASVRGPAAKLAVLEQVLRRAEPGVAKYFIKIITGDLRIGLKESLVEEAIARAYARPIEQVRRANMLSGDIGATLCMAAADRLAEAGLRMFRPVSCMLASPVESAADALAEMPEGGLVEDKYDGIRAQVHKSGGEVKLYSRTLDEIVEFHELSDPLAALPGEFVMDGEVVAWREGRALPFTQLQQRLGRKQPELWLPLEIPVRFVAFDLLYLNGESLLDTPLAERRRRLEELLAGSSSVRPSPAQAWSSADLLKREFKGALARGNEGIVIKASASPYLPGRRGRWWLKWKQPLATLDVVVTAVEYGHGKRHGLLSDYTFAVRDGQDLVDIGKAYSGLTDEEIRRFTEYFLAHTIEDQGFRRRVAPVVVVEVAFNNIQRSKRHASGYALRFPRIVRLRPDKSPQEADTIERVRALYESQAV